MRGHSAISLHLQLGLGHTIRARRQAMGLTQEALAARIGIGRSHVGRVEAGRHALMLGTIELFAFGLGCLTSELVADAEAIKHGRRADLTVQEAAE